MGVSELISINEFELFWENQCASTSSSVFLGYFCITLAIVFCSAIETLQGGQGESSEGEEQGGHSHYNSPLIVLRLSVLIPIWIQAYILLQRNYSNLLPKLPFSSSIISSIIIIYSSLSSAVALIYGTYLGQQCDLLNCVNVLPHGLQPNLLLSVLVTVYVGPFVLKVHKLWSVYISVSILFASFIYSAYLAHSPVSTYRVLIVSCCLTALVLYDNEMTLRRVYLSHNSLTQTITLKLDAEYEKELMDIKSEELRILIGNAAHDLKSPLQSFAFELDTLLSFNFGSHQREVTDSILLLKSICSFMAMMINRAIDFTKVSSGFHLIPSYDTIHLTHTIQWVRECTLRSSQRLPILIRPISIDLCSHIITDRQWLTENLLCLISNAQKFSTEGAIDVRCFLVKKEAPDVPVDSSHSLPSRWYSTLFPSNSSLRDESTGTENLLLRLEVEDNGIGIPDESKNRLFQPFQQAQKRAGGTGLGLFSLSKRVESLGGTCGVINRRDGKMGSCFWFTLPYRPDHLVSQNQNETSSEGFSIRSQSHSCVSLNSPMFVFDRLEVAEQELVNILFNDKKEESEDLSHPTGQFRSHPPQEDEVCLLSSNSLSSPQGESSGLTLTSTESALNVLLVEDSILIQKTTTRALIREGYQVDAAPNGLECLKMLAKKDYQVILMDLQMPVMDGFEATRRIREMEIHSPNDISSLDVSYENLQLSEVRQISLPTQDDDIESRLQQEQNILNQISISRSTSLTPRHHLIIGLSANSDHISTLQAIESGMDDFISKPLTMKILKECIEKNRDELGKGNK